MSIYDIVMIAMCYLYLYGHWPIVVNGAGMLMANAQILVTALAVTLSATLLGIEFRAQSYTTLIIMKQINNSIVYTFVIIFVSLIIISISLAVWIPEKELSKYVPLVFLGTIFSMLYLSGYIYHMIHRLQPHMIMAEVEKDINEILKINGLTEQNDRMNQPLSPTINIAEWNAVMLKHSSAEYRIKHEKFDAWKQIMLRAIETDNVVLFERGLNQILETYDKAMNSILNVEGKKIRELIETMMKKTRFLSNEKFKKFYYEHTEKINQLIPTSHFFIEYIRDVMADAIEKNRDLCVLSFMRAFGERDQSYLRKYGWYFGPSIIFDIWYDVMRRCISEGKDHLVQEGVDHLEKKLNQQLSISDKNRDEDCKEIIIRGVYHYVLVSLVSLAVEKNNIYQKEYLELLSKYWFPHRRELSYCEKKLHPYPISPWGEREDNLRLFELMKYDIDYTGGWLEIVENAYEKGNIPLFRHGINIVYSIQYNSEHPYRKTSTNDHELVKIKGKFPNEKMNSGFKMLLHNLRYMIDNIEENRHIYYIVTALNTLNHNSQINELWMYCIRKIIMSKNPDLENIRSDLKSILKKSMQPGQVDYTKLRKQSLEIFSEVSVSRGIFIELVDLERIGKRLSNENDK